jgi:tRNA A-37 threonylcarbamoyl transferase component Bud32
MVYTYKMTFIKAHVSFKEFMMHEYIYTLSLNSNGALNVPKIIDYNAEAQVLEMENIPQMCVADFYGEKASDISAELFSTIREAIRFLYANHIIYPDITGYNFIEHEGKVWIIDFEHSDFESYERNIFVDEFVNDDTYNEWNPWFA